MKKATKQSLSLLLALCYLFACMGFGIHTCHDDGSRHFVLLYGDVSCEAIHHHSHDADHDHHHDHGCCSTHVYVLTDAQDNDHATDRLADMPGEGLPTIAETPVFASLLSVFPARYDFDTPPPIAPPSLSLLSVWLV